MENQANPRILIVEDDDVNCLVITHFLQNKGYSVEGAVNGQKALALLGNESFDFVLMDISLPKIDGIKLVKQMKKYSHTKSIPVVAMSSDTSDEDRTRFIEAGMDAFISKPIDLEELFKLILQFTSSNMTALDWPGLLIITGGDRCFIQQVADLFCQTSLETINKITNSNDLKRIKELAHRLNGSANTAGASSVAKLAQQIYQTAEQGDLEQLVQICTGYEAAIASYRQALTNMGIILQ